MLHLQRVDESGLVQEVEEELHAVLPEATLFDDVLHLEGIDAHVLGFADETLFEDALVHVELLCRVDFLAE